MDIPPGLSRTVPGWFGDAGRRWLDELPAIIDQLTRRWSLAVTGVTDARTGLVAHVRLEDGTTAVLKVAAPGDEMAEEPAALRTWNGLGAVRLLDHDPQRQAMLIERCEPGTSLWEAPDELLEVASAVQRRLWVPAPPRVFEPLVHRTSSWADVLESRAWRSGYAQTEALEAAALLRELPSTASSEVLLHGDFQPGNVLSASREPWLAIDPQPSVGDPAFDPAQLVLNLVTRGWEAEDVVGRLASELSLDPQRIRAWSFARAVESALWELGMGDRPGADSSMEAARRVW